MATEAKPFASLSSGLLARKGAARPAMRPQGFGQVTGGLEDLGWNDMGFEPPKPAQAARDTDHDAFGEEVVEYPRAHATGLTPIQSPVHDQQAELAERLTGANNEVETEIDEPAEIFAVEADKPARIFEVEADDPAGIFEVEAGNAAANVEFEIEEKTIAVAAPAPLAVIAPVPVRTPHLRSAPGSKAKAAFTLRLEPERHLKLRLACAVDGRSAQQLVTDALDQLLERMPELEGLAAKAKRRG